MTLGTLRSRVAVPGMLAITLCFGAARSSRDDWQHLKDRADFTQHLDYSLEDAPLSTQERTQIYTLIDHDFVHDWYRKDESEAEHKMVLSSRVALIALKGDSSRQILVRPPLRFCGVSGNCPLVVFMRGEGKIKPILSGEGKSLLAGNNSSHGFTDLAILYQDSAFEAIFTVYRWSNSKYKRLDCYVATSEMRHTDKPPVISNCPVLSR